jgi:hypothetical protein
MKPTTEQIITWGREALNETGDLIPTEWNIKLLEAICSVAYEAGRKDENEACAKVCDESANEAPNSWQFRMGANHCAEAIRARGQE